MAKVSGRYLLLLTLLVSVTLLLPLLDGKLGIIAHSVDIYQNYRLLATDTQKGKRTSVMTSPEPVHNGGSTKRILQVLPNHLQNSDQHDPELIQHVRDHWIVKPSEEPLSLSRPTRIHFSQYGQSEFVDNLLNNLTNGFFVECGAATGEQISNTLFFERHRAWTGILIEANPISFQSILRKNRKAYMVNACLSPGRTPMLVNFTTARAVGGISHLMTHVPKANFLQGMMEVQCLPFYSILSAVGVRHIDYFSLDTEGSELQILQSLPLDEIDVDVFGVEITIRNDPVAQSLKKNLVEGFLREHGYKKIKAPFIIDSIMRKVEQR